MGEQVEPLTGLGFHSHKAHNKAVRLSALKLGCGWLRDWPGPRAMNACFVPLFPSACYPVMFKMLEVWKFASPGDYAVRNLLTDLQWSYRENEELSFC